MTFRWGKKKGKVPYPPPPHPTVSGTKRRRVRSTNQTSKTNHQAFKNAAKYQGLPRHHGGQLWAQRPEPSAHGREPMRQGIGRRTCFLVLGDHRQRLGISRAAGPAAAALSSMVANKRWRPQAVALPLRNPNNRGARAIDRTTARPTHVLAPARAAAGLWPPPHPAPAIL